MSTVNTSVKRTDRQLLESKYRKQLYNYLAQCEDNGEPITIRQLGEKIGICHVTINGFMIRDKPIQSAILSKIKTFLKYNWDSKEDPDYDSGAVYDQNTQAQSKA